MFVPLLEMKKEKQKHSIKNRNGKWQPSYKSM